jgi:hypothetical protein
MATFYQQNSWLAFDLGKAQKRIQWNMTRSLFPVDLQSGWESKTHLWKENCFGKWGHGLWRGRSMADLPSPSVFSSTRPPQQNEYSRLELRQAPKPVGPSGAVFHLSNEDNFGLWGPDEFGDVHTHSKAWYKELFVFFEHFVHIYFSLYRTLCDSYLHTCLSYYIAGGYGR